MTWAALCALRDRIVYFKPGMRALHLQRTVGVGSGVSAARASGPCLNGTHSPGLGALRLGGTETPGVYLPGGWGLRVPHRSFCCLVSLRRFLAISRCDSLGAW